MKPRNKMQAQREHLTNNIVHQQIGRESPSVLIHSGKAIRPRLLNRSNEYGSMRPIG